MKADAAGTTGTVGAAGTVARWIRHPARNLHRRRVVRQVHRALARAAAGDMATAGDLLTRVMWRGKADSYLMWLCFARRVGAAGGDLYRLAPDSPYALQVFTQDGEQVADPDQIPDETVRAGVWAVRFLCAFLTGHLEDCLAIYGGLWPDDDLWTAATLHLTWMAVNATRDGSRIAAGGCPVHGEGGCGDG